MKKEFFLFGSCLFLFILHQLLEKCFHVRIEKVDNYLDALVCLPIILQLIVWERRVLLKDAYYRLPLLHIAGYFVLLSILGELLFPALSNRFTADGWDVLCYAAGTFLFIGVNSYHRIY
ncbi:hypothetical protein L0U88_08260 [Flavihumibacter sp. RY-1]|uniref:Magnesium citrate secondary transporter n=1 Tax=Flavihumibacter fluminis TaxID=2909236 RepID=A0ABS9BH62_9BACT|nr:hypothetical protein [Flavihumibacter fluminis]MCF1714615.1 hypothetical protein [Flavihumibacter fluminis]